MSDKDSNSSYTDKDLLDELQDLKSMLEMQEIINQKQGKKLLKCEEEKQNLVAEKASCVNKLSKMQIDVDANTKVVFNLEEKISKLEIALDTEKKHSNDEREKVIWLTKDNQNLLQTLDKKSHRIKKLKCQLEEERSFYEQEKARYCKEMKRRKNHSTEVQTDNSTIEDDLLCSKNCGSINCNELNRLRSLYKHQLITTCLICEKYIRLQKYKTVLMGRLLHTRKEYKKSMCDIMMEFDKCKTEYSSLLEDKCYENNTGRMLKIINRSNRLASDNAVLKQELLHLNNRISLLRCYNNFKSEQTNLTSKSGSGNTSSRKKHRRRYRIRMKDEKEGSDHNSEKYITSFSSMPESTENESVCNTNGDYIKRARRRRFKRYRKRTEKLNSKKSYSSESSDFICSDNSDNNTGFNNFNRVNVCSSFISYGTGKTAVKSNLKRQYDYNFRNSGDGMQMVRFGDTNKDKMKSHNLQKVESCQISEPAYIQVTCDEIKPLVKDGKIIQNGVRKCNDLKTDLQEWLAKTPIIECSEWSKSVQGMEVMKTESAPEIVLFRSLSSLLINTEKQSK